MNKKINVLYLSVGTGGSDKALLNMLDGLTNYNIDPLVIINKRSGLKKELIKNNIKHIELDYKFNIWPRFTFWKDIIRYPWRVISNPVKNYLAVLKLIKIIKIHKIDLIHTNVGVINIGHKAALKCDIPHVWHLREYQDLDFDMHPFPTKGSFLKSLYHTNNYPVAITKGIFNHFKLNISNSSWIYDGVLPEKRTNFLPDKEKYFLFVGSITENKGVSELIEAFIQFSKYDQEFELKIIGKVNSNEYTKLLFKKVKENSLQDRIKFLGYCNDVHSFMATAMALIVPSKFEGFGFITAEAMFNGCLVIGKNTGGTKEQFDNGLNHHGLEIAIRYTTLNELISAMNNVRTNGSQHYFKQIKNAQETAKQLYSIEKYTYQIQLIYKEILKRNNRKIV